MVFVKRWKKLIIHYLTSKADDPVIPIAKENYQDIGIKFEPEIMDFNALVSKLSDKDYDLATVSTSQILDPSDPVEELATNHPNNSAGYSNPKVDELIQKAYQPWILRNEKRFIMSFIKSWGKTLPSFLFITAKVLKRLVVKLKV